MTLAAVDRLVRHATIFEMNVESYRRRSMEAKRQRGRPPTFVTITDTSSHPDRRAIPDCVSPANKCGIRRRMARNRCLRSLLATARRFCGLIFGTWRRLTPYRGHQAESSINRRYPTKHVFSDT